MRFAPIVPLGCEDMIPDTGYNIVFSNLVLRDTQYAEWAMSLRRMNPGHFVLLDHLIFEGQAAPSLDLIVEVAKIVRPTCVVAPDVPGDMEHTLDLFYGFAHFLDKVNIRTEAMGVLQGKSYDQLKHCFTEMTNWTDYIGFPKRAAKGAGTTRHHFIRSLQDEWLADHKIHLLGGDWPYQDVTELADHPNVIGVDSAGPTTAAILGLSLSNPACELLRRPGGFYDLPRRWLEDNRARFHDNVLHMQHVAERGLWLR